MIRAMVRSLLLLSLSLVCALATPAAARSEKTLAYTRDQAWTTAVRFVRVDERLAVSDKDEGAGYILFELVDDGKKFRGSLEVISVVIDGRPAVRFVVAIEDRPSYVELGMLMRLEKKLKLELGAPAPTPTKPMPPVPPVPPAPGPPEAKPAPTEPMKPTP